MSINTTKMTSLTVNDLRERQNERATCSLVDFLWLRVCRTFVEGPEVEVKSVTGFSGHDIRLILHKLL